MIYETPEPDAPLTQGDIIDECPWCSGQPIADHQRTSQSVFIEPA